MIPMNTASMPGVIGRVFCFCFVKKLYGKRTASDSFAFLSLKRRLTLPHRPVGISGCPCLLITYTSTAILLSSDVQILCFKPALYKP